MLGGQLEHSGEVLHAANEYVWGEGVPLSNATFPHEEPVDVTIDCNREGSSRHTLHDKDNKLCWKTKVVEKVFYKSPLNRVKCFLKVYLQQTAGG